MTPAECRGIRIPDPEDSEDGGPMTVLYFVGWCRSGTTVLGNILNEIDGFFHTGELHFLWKNGVLRRGSNTRCGCGRDLLSCSLWSHVLHDECPAGESLHAHAEHVLRWQATRFRTRHTWWLLRQSPELLLRDPRCAGYLRTLRRTYRAIQRATGARVIVDTGKYASEAAVLLHLPGVRPAFVHQVRDPRATAHSWRRPKAYIPSRGPFDSTVHWIGFNLAAEAVCRRQPDRSLRVRYEDFVHDPVATVRDILLLVGEDPRRNPVAPDGSVTVRPNHTVTGNPDRFSTGTIRLEPDDRWRWDMPRWQQAAVGAAAMPWMARYGYA